jgi:hypothetical protein
VQLDPLAVLCCSGRIVLDFAEGDNAVGTGCGCKRGRDHNLDDCEKRSLEIHKLGEFFLIASAGDGFFDSKIVICRERVEKCAEVEISFCQCRCDVV